MLYKQTIEKYFGEIISDQNIRYTHGRDYDIAIYKNTVFRFPRTKSHDIHLEKRKIDILHNHIDMNIPHYNIINNEYMIYDEIMGISMDSIKTAYTDTIIKQLSYFLKQLHSIPLDEFTFLTDQQKDPSHLIDFTHDLKDDIEKKLSKKVPQYVIKNLTQYIDELFFTYKSSKEAFIHGDLQKKNIIIDEENKRISGIVDFTDSRIGGIEGDFCDFLVEDITILKKAIKEYFGYEHKEFIENVSFIVKRGVIFEIYNNDFFKNNFSYIEEKLKEYKFM